MRNSSRPLLLPKTTAKNRRGALAVFTAMLLVPLIGMLAFSIDVGYLLKKRAELQRAADAAALAAVRDLVPDVNGDQDLDKVRETLRSYAGMNITDVSGFTVLDEDITIGRFEPETVYTDFTILDDGILDTVRVTLRRDGSANAPIPLFFAGIFGIINSDVSATATAVLQKASILRPGADVLPIAVPQEEWEPITAKDPAWNIYGDGRIYDDAGDQVPGNWGTLNLGPSSNSTESINDQILNGLQQSHLDALRSEGRISSNEMIDSSEAFNSNGDPGLSAGMKSSIDAILGQTRLIPIYDTMTGEPGNNLEFHITGWGVALVTDSRFKGSKNTFVAVKKAYTFDGTLRPNRDLSVTEGVIEGAYTTPVLVE